MKEFIWNDDLVNEFAGYCNDKVQGGVSKHDIDKWKENKIRELNDKPTITWRSMIDGILFMVKKGSAQLAEIKIGTERLTEIILAMKEGRLRIEQGNAQARCDEADKTYWEKSKRESIPQASSSPYDPQRIQARIDILEAEKRGFEIAREKVFTQDPVYDWTLPTYRDKYKSFEDYLIKAHKP